MPGTAAAAGPTWKSCWADGYTTVMVVGSAHGPIRSRPGTAVKKSHDSTVPSGWATMAKPPPARLVRPGSATVEAKPAATAASIAEPPSDRTVTAAAVVAALPVATAAEPGPPVATAGMPGAVLTNPTP